MTNPDREREAAFMLGSAVAFAIICTIGAVAVVLQRGDWTNGVLLVGCSAFVLDQARRFRRKMRGLRRD